MKQNKFSINEKSNISKSLNRNDSKVRLYILQTSFVKFIKINQLIKNRKKRVFYWHMTII
ncbi:hypothetical protein [Mesomycoplasma dispar]|uniref:Uncharacterized protein n=1 Tax=Mesomycoplasma dispar TaxID=86660 RepID=A0ABM6PRI4_9BACT|nr:hypothetical protein [Mesomycoplasma dispar]ATP59763.1 hypothetical protein CSW10_02345 [Mesomycoplasma dispar]